MKDEIALGEAQSCAGCRYLRKFKAREDERERFGYVTEFGYGCDKPGYEGYTQLHAWCPSFSAADALLAQREKKL